MPNFSNRFTGLWRSPDFLKLWSGETVSLLGTQVTTLALPLTAALTLHASPSQMGFLNAAQFAPYLLITLFAGIWVDRIRKRPLMIGVNLARGLLLGGIPAAFWLGVLRMEILYGLVFLLGICSVLFEVAYISYLPSLVKREELVEGNSKLQASASFADVGARGPAGLLIDWVSAPMAILVNSVTSLYAAMALLSIRKPEPVPASPTGHDSVWKSIRNGLTLVFHSPYLRPIVCEAATYNLFSQVIWAVAMLYMTRELNLTPTLLGIIMAAGSIGGLLGAFSASYWGKRIGIGPAIIASMAIGCAAPMLIPLAQGSHWAVAAVLMLSFFLGGFGISMSIVHIISLRQAVTPAHLAGRVAACYRFVASGAVPVGALLGGMLGELLGLRITLFVGAFGTLTALGWIVFSPVAKLRELPTSVQQEAA